MVKTTGFHLDVTHIGNRRGV